MSTAAPLARWRRITIWVLIVLAGLIGLVSAVTVWAKRQALDTDKWVATSSRLLEDDEIRGALSLYLVDQLYENVDVAAELQQSLPEQVKPLAAPIAGGLRELSVRAADNLLSRPAVQTLWEEANRRAHCHIVPQHLATQLRELLANRGGCRPARRRRRIVRRLGLR